MNLTIRSALSLYERREFLTGRGAYTDFLQIIMDATSSEVGYLHLYNPDTEELALNVWSQSVLKMCKTVHTSHYPIAEAGIWAECIRKNRPVIHNDYPNRSDKKGMPEGHFPLDSHMSVPIYKDEKIIAVIGQGNAKAPYNNESVAITEAFIKAGWPIVEKKLKQVEGPRAHKIQRFTVHEAKPLMKSMISAIAYTLEVKEEFSRSHQEKTAQVSVAIAKEMGMGDEFIFGLELAAVVHDFGKIHLPADLLNKTDALTISEFKLIKEHPITGAKIFEHIDAPWPIFDAVRQHHERMDGSGYPDGLLGNMICLEARILMVADVFEAMNSDRPYRKAPGWDKAIECIENGRNSLFDPYVVDAFMRLIEKDNPAVVAGSP